jgi:hypothetical protein
VLAKHLDRQGRPGPFVAVCPGDEGHPSASRTGFAIFERDVLGGGVRGDPDLAPYQRFKDGFQDDILPESEANTFL